MDELIKKALSFARGMWKFRWPGLVAAWVVSLAGAVVVFKIPDQYEASARIFVDTQSILQPLMAGLTVQPNVQQQVNMLSRTLLSRPNLEKLVRMADLDLGITTPAERDALITRLGSDIQIRNTGRDNLYTLAIKDSDQDRAQRIVQSLTTIFVESSLGASRQDTNSAKSFLDEQIRRYEQKLDEADTRLKEFRIRTIEMRSDDGKDAATRVAEAARALEATRLELREAENARETIKQQIAQERSAGPSRPSAISSFDPTLATPELDARINELQRTTDSLLQRYTEQHPDIVIIRRQIAELERQKAAELEERRKLAAARAEAEGSPADANPAVQELSRMLASVEVQAASLRTRAAEFNARLVQAREALKTAPELESELAQLNRDYAVNKRNYDDLVARRQTAVMSGELESAGAAEFRLIDPPRVSPKPVSPNRVAILPVPLLAGLGAGLALALLLSQLRPVFHDPADLRQLTGLPLLGVVSMRVDEATRRKERRGLIGFASASLGLVGLFGIGLALTATLS